MDFDVYGQAVIHFAWYRNDKSCHLLFGMVELRPKELPRALGCSMKSIRYGSKGRKYLHYQRFASSVSGAVTWYRDVIGGCLLFPDDTGCSNSDEERSLHGGPFVQEPIWPEFVTSNDLVFAPDWMQGSRSHFLFPKEVTSPDVAEAIESEKIRKKLEEWLNFDIVLTYPDYQGSICLVAPNPLFRTVDKSHLERPRSGFAESVAYKIVVRAGQSPEGLRLEVVNERLRGRMAPMVHEFGNDAIVTFDLPADIYKEGESITHSDYGLLSWHDPLPIIRTINVGMEIHRRRKHVRVPSVGRRGPEYDYDVDEVESAGDFTVGDAVSDADILSRLTEAANRRTRRHVGEEHGQQWFSGAPADAAQFIRKKIGDARKSVLIVDPYFSAHGLMAFGHATRRPNVELRILTSAEGLKETLKDDSNVRVGLELQNALNGTFDKMPTKPEIRVLAGKLSPVHDRFLAIDGEVWFSGNSLSTLGQRAGVIVRLPDPEPIMRQLDAFWLGARVLFDWLSERDTEPTEN